MEIEEKELKTMSENHSTQYFANEIVKLQRELVETKAMINRFY